MIGNIISKILLAAFLIASPFLIYGFGRAVFDSIKKFSVTSPDQAAFAIGLILFFPIWFLARRYFQTIWHYLTTLEHECTHAVVGLLFGKIPVSMRVSAWEGGEVHLRGGSNVWISLAPYFLPTISFLVFLIFWLAGLTDSTYFYGVLGWTIAFHLVTNWQETSFRQSDLQKAGFLTSLLILPTANLLTYGALLSLVFGGTKSFGEFWLSGGKNSWQTFQQIFRFY